MMRQSWLLRPTEFVRRLLSHARGLLTWQLVRGVGELQILTRASYVMLALVPLLGGAWPSMRVVINRHNQILETSANDLAAAAATLDDRVNAMAATAERATAPLADVKAVRALASKVSSFSAEVTDSLANLRRQATLSPWLPSSWALAFFAALAVAFGHALYQSQAPEVVKRYTLIGYRRERRDAYKEQPDQYELEKALGPVRDAWWKRVPSAEIKALEDERRHTLKIREETRNINLSFSTPHDVMREVLYDWKRAIEAIIIAPNDRTSKAGDDAAANEEVRSLMFPTLDTEQVHRLRSVLYWYDDLSLYDECQKIEREQNKHMYPDFAKAPAIQDFKDELFRGMAIETHDVSRERMLAKGVDVVGDAARLEYLKLCMQKPAFIASTLTLYAIGLTIVAILIFRQSAAVMQASGWI